MLAFVFNINVVLNNCLEQQLIDVVVIIKLYLGIIWDILQVSSATQVVNGGCCKLLSTPAGDSFEKCKKGIKAHGGEFK